MYREGEGFFLLLPSSPLVSLKMAELTEKLLDFCNSRWLLRGLQYYILASNHCTAQWCILMWFRFEQVDSHQIRISYSIINQENMKENIYRKKSVDNSWHGLNLFQMCTRQGNYWKICWLSWQNIEWSKKNNL